MVCLGVLAMGSVAGQVIFTPIQAKFGLSVGKLAIQLTARDGSRTVATTDDAGSFRFDHLRWGRYEVSFRGPGGNAVAWRAVVDSARSATAVTFNFRETTAAPSLALIPIENPTMRRQLLDMAAEDQRIRRAWIAADVNRPNPRAMAAMATLSQTQLGTIRKIIARGGWPSPRLVGQDGAEAAFLIVQHAAPNTQLSLYPMVESAYRSGWVRPDHFAMFTDRVLLARGQKQRYGTVAAPFAAWTDGVPTFEPIEDEANVDERREKMGLMPISQYRTILQKMYAPR